MPFNRKKPSIAPDHSNLKVPATPTDQSQPPRSDVDFRGPSSALLTRPKPSPDLTASRSANFVALLAGLYHWATCLFIFGLVFSQLLGAIQDSTTTEEHAVYGRSPHLGPSQIVGSNDVPYPDRVIACVGKGHFYEPMLVSSLLAAPGTSAILQDSTGSAVHGYRLKQRRPGSVADSLDSIALPLYVKSCSLIAETFDNIAQACLALGYTNLTHDNLHVVDDWDSTNLYELPNTLPILIMPYWDNAVYARHAIPTWGGDACVFRLEDAYVGNGGRHATANFRGVNQSVRHERTIEWLNRTGGQWKNGWYEDNEGMRWYSDVTSSAKGAPYFMMHRVFDMIKGEELDCSDPVDCEGVASVDHWGNKLSAEIRSHKLSSVYIANGSEYGFFLYEAYESRTLRSVFDWETLLSNMCKWWILHRWLLAQVLLLANALRGVSQRYGGGIKCVAASRSFAILPLMSLPKLKMTLTAFWTVGCEFEGQQSALSGAWFVIYPAIAHFMLIYFSVLNLLGKILRRRVSDVLFTPSVVSLCLLHYCRIQLAGSGWLDGIDGRVATVVFSDELNQLTLADLFTTDAAWRLNGRVQLVFTLKLCILAVNLLPLVLSRSFPVRQRGSKMELFGMEKALALSASQVGGLGNSTPYVLAVVDATRRQLISSKLYAPTSRSGGGANSKVHTDTTPGDGVQVVLLGSYELLRLGYVVFGDSYVTTLQGYGRLCAMTPLRAFFHLWNHRVLVWTLRPVDSSGDAEIAGGRALESTEPQMWRLDDPRLSHIRWWHVSVCSIQC